MSFLTPLSTVAVTFVWRDRTANKSSCKEGRTRLAHGSGGQFLLADSIGLGLSEAEYRGGRAWRRTAVHSRPPGRREQGAGTE